MEVEIDSKSGFCFGVVYAITKAEEELENEENLYCLGDIVHNNEEVKRLKSKGLITINHQEFSELKNCKVLIRAHGEPPETYRIAAKNNIDLVDATCPVVLRLQNKIKTGFDTASEENGQIVIYGKQGHAEVNGLVGQTLQKAIVVNSIDDLTKIDFTKKIVLYSQTTQSIEGFYKISSEIEKRCKENGIAENLIVNDTICRQVSNRGNELKDFADKHDVIIFVSGKKSSNGKMLYNVCKTVNANTFFVSDINDLSVDMFQEAKTVGVCGATSTPGWLMAKIANEIRKMY